MRPARHRDDQQHRCDYSALVEAIVQLAPSAEDMRHTRSVLLTRMTTQPAAAWVYDLAAWRAPSLTQPKKTSTRPAACYSCR